MLLVCYRRINTPFFLYYEKLISSNVLTLAHSPRSNRISIEVCDCKDEQFPLTRPFHRPPPRCTGDRCIGGQRQNFVPSPTPGQAWIPPLHSLPRVRRLLRSRRRCYSSPRLRPPPRCCPIPPSFLSTNQSTSLSFWREGGLYMPSDQIQVYWIAKADVIRCAFLTVEEESSRPPCGCECGTSVHLNGSTARTRISPVQHSGARAEKAQSRRIYTALEWACRMPPTVTVSRHSGVIYSLWWGEKIRQKRIS